MTDETPDRVINVDDAPAHERPARGQWGAKFQVLTPAMRPLGGELGVNRMVIPPGHAAVPFHSHRLEDEVFYVLEGRGVLRYGDEPLRELRPGDCVSCPHGTGNAHQLANPFDEDFAYLAIGRHDPEEVCVYPDTGKVFARGIQQIGRITQTDYMDGEPDRPKILDLHDEG